MPVNRFLPGLDDEDLLAEFANLGHEGPDPLDDLAGVRAWWTALGAQTPASADPTADLELLRALRRSVQELGLANNGVAVEVGGAVLGALPLHLVLDDGPRLVAAGESGLVGTVAGALASALVRSSARATWPRLKACPGPDCAYVFRDRTRNGSRRWCLMSECGNRAKGAAYRARAAGRG